MVFRFEELFQVAFEGHGISKLKESKQPFLHLHLERQKHSTILNISKQTARLSVHKRLEYIVKLTAKTFFFFCEDKQSLINNKRLDFLMISISACFLSDAALAIAILLQDLFFFLISDFVLELGKMSTEETETSAEYKPCSGRAAMIVYGMKRSGVHYQNCENQSQAPNLQNNWPVVSNGRVIAPPTLVPNFWPCF